MILFEHNLLFFFYHFLEMIKTAFFNIYTEMFIAPSEISFK